MLKEILTRSAELVRAGWTQHLAARDVRGDEVKPTSEDACQFCLVGALDRAVHEHEGSVDYAVSCAVRDHVRKFLADQANQSLVVFNDTENRRLSEVADLLDRAAAAVV